MRTPVTLYCYQVPLARNLRDIIRLWCLRICLFLFTASFRHFGPAMTIALLLFLVGITGEPLDVHHLQLSTVLALSIRLVSILLGLGWLGLGLCRLSMQLANADTWQQELQTNEASLRHRISILEDWIVWPRRGGK